MFTARNHVTLVVGLLVPFAAGCATKSFVTETVADRAAIVDSRVSAVERSVEEVADDTRANATRLGEVDRTATTALDTARSADSSARGAGETAAEAMTRVQSLELASRQQLFEVVLTEDQGKFGFADTALPEPASSSLDALVAQARSRDVPVHFEVEGYTDESGPAEYNLRLGLERAETVRRYLHEQHTLPLHQISVISYGEERPVAPNDTAEGRAANRRVVVRVLASTSDQSTSVAQDQD